PEQCHRSQRPKDEKHDSADDAQSTTDFTGSASILMVTFALDEHVIEVGLIGIRPQRVHDCAHGCFRFGLCQHGLMKTDLRISIKDYRRSVFQGQCKTDAFPPEPNSVAAS
ncbi:MAG TPA: hypothetical protein VF480_00745, partial [Verrucomicrobiae bacterium]